VIAVAVAAQLLTMRGAGFAGD